MADGVKKVNEWIMKPGRVLGITIPDFDPTKLEGGTLYVNPTQGSFRYVHLDNAGKKSWVNFDPVNIFNSQSITEGLLKDLSVTTRKLADGAVTNVKYAEDSISTTKLKDRCVTSIKYALGSVLTETLANQSVTREKIYPLAVDETKIADEAVTTNKIKPLNVTNNCLANGTIENLKIKDKTLTNQKIADLTLTNSLYAEKSITGNKIGDYEVVTRCLGNGSVAHEKLGTGSVYGDKVPNDGIESRHIKSLDGNRIMDNTINFNKLMNDSVRTNAIKNLSVTFSKLDNSTQDLINESIRVIPSQSINNQTYFDTALVNGNMAIKNPKGNTKLTVFGNIEATGDITGARVFNPYFCDVAEAYVPVEPVEAGDAVCICEDGELQIEKLNEENADRFIGFVSNEHAMVLGATRRELDDKIKVPVALIGRIHVKCPACLEGKAGNYVNVNKGKVNIYFSHGKTEHTVGRLLKPKKHGETEMFCQVWP